AAAGSLSEAKPAQAKVRGAGFAHIGSFAGGRQRAFGISGEKEKRQSMKELRTYLDRNNIYYDEEMMCKFDAYRGGVLQWNEFVNLTAIRDPEEFTLKHFVDSVTCVKLPEYEAAEKIIDMGTGAGFPGV